MPWLYDPDGDVVDVYAPDGTRVARDVPLDESWTDHPTAVDDVAVDTILALDTTLDLRRLLRWLIELQVGDVQEGRP